MLTAWRAWQEAQGLSQRTIEERIATVDRLLRASGATPLTLSPDDVIAFLRHQHLSPSTRSTYHTSIRAFTKWMQRTGRRVDDPVELTPSPRRPKSIPRPVDGELVEAMLRGARKRTTRTYVLLAAFAGLRVHEIAKFSGRHVDPYTQTFIVVGKGGKIARLPMHPLLVEEARHYPADDWWFPSPSRQGPVRSHAVSKSIRDSMRRAGYDGKPHQLRHFYGTELVRANVHLRVVQELMRHESPATTAIYTRIDDAQLRAGIAKLPFAAALRPLESAA